jgi:hypothetical protein
MIERVAAISFKVQVMCWRAWRKAGHDVKGGALLGYIVGTSWVQVVALQLHQPAWLKPAFCIGLVYFSSGSERERTHFDMSMTLHFSTTILTGPRPSHVGYVSEHFLSTVRSSTWMKGWPIARSLPILDSTFHEDDDTHSCLKRDSNAGSQYRSVQGPSVDWSCSFCHWNKKERFKTVIKSEIYILL